MLYRFRDKRAISVENRKFSQLPVYVTQATLTGFPWNFVTLKN